MEPIEIALGVAFPVLVGAGLAVLGMASSNPLEYWVARALFALSGLDLISLTIWWLYKSDGTAWRYAVGCAVVVLVLVLLPAALKWTDIRQAAAEKKEPNDYGVLFAPDGSGILPAVEVGQSGTFLPPFQITNPDSAQYIPGLLSSQLKIERINGKIKVSALMKDSDGNVLAVLNRNEWQTAAKPVTWDRNYNDNALEVEDAKGRVVLQVRVLANRIQLQGVWPHELKPNPAHIELIEIRENPENHIAEFIMNGSKTEWPLIQPMFKYPSNLHFGDLAK